MKTILKFATTAALTGALALAMATPSEARHGRNAAAIGGFAAGAVVGAAAASAANSGGYYYGSGYDDSGYAYRDAGYGYDGYAYAPGPSYADEGYAASYAPRGCWVSTDDARGYGYYGSCASHNVDTDAGTLGNARPNVRGVR